MAALNELRHMAKPLLFLGAGASYGSEADKSLVPPLAASLFKELYAFEANVWGKIPAPVAEALRADFENGMLELYARAPHALTVAQRSMAAFFYRYAPSATSLYRRIAKRIIETDWTGAFATLNYERMLLMALAQAGLKSNCGGPEGVTAKLEVCSTGRAYNAIAKQMAATMWHVSMDGRAVTTNGPVKAIEHSDQFWHRLRTDAFPPVMSYFEPSKFTTSGANFIEDQRARLKTLIAEAPSIAVIGIQVREQDAHIWNALASTKSSRLLLLRRKGRQDLQNLERNKPSRRP